MSAVAKVSPISKHWRYSNDKIWTEDEITNFIIEEVGFDVIRPTGYQILLKKQVKPEKTAGGIIWSNDALLNSKDYTRVARILDMGPYAYKGDRFIHGAYCHIGDLISYKEYEHRDLPVKDTDLILVTCDKIICQIKDLEKIIL